MRCFLSVPFTFAAFDVSTNVTPATNWNVLQRLIVHPSLHPHYGDFLTTMGSADFPQSVFTTAYETTYITSALKVSALSPHLSAAFTVTYGYFWASSFIADLPVFPCLICGFCSSDHRFAYNFL